MLGKVEVLSNRRALFSAHAPHDKSLSYLTKLRTVLAGIFGWIPIGKTRLQPFTRDRAKPPPQHCDNHLVSALAESLDRAF